MTQARPNQPAAIEEHMAISQKALAFLGYLLDGNGLKTDQLRLTRHDTQVHEIHGMMTVRLQAEVNKSPLRGRSPSGQVLGSEGDVMAQVNGLIKTFSDSPDVQQNVMTMLSQQPGSGFAMESATLVLPSAKREFSVIETCQFCRGAASIPCQQCNQSGAMPCMGCNGQGFASCQPCFGSGQIQMPDGSRGPCPRCHAVGRIPCQVCNGRRQVACTLCQGQGHTPCNDCGQSGHMTSNYHVIYKADCSFDADMGMMPPDAVRIAETMGLQALAKGNAEIIRHFPQPRDGGMVIPYIAFFPVAKAEFSVEGKPCPAVVAGLKGAIVDIEPVLDRLVKPGIVALKKLTTGPLASEALMATACKYRLIRETLGNLTRMSKKQAYQKLTRDYPVVLSDKYARAAILFGHQALSALGTMPRRKGLLIGIILAALICYSYFMTGARVEVMIVMQQQGIGRHILLADMLVWALASMGGVYIIRLMASRAFKRLLPTAVTAEHTGLPSSGAEGIYAWMLALTAWFVMAGMAETKPFWIIPILHTIKTNMEL